MLRDQELHQMERQNAVTKQSCWAASKSKSRYKLSQKLTLPYLNSNVLAARKLQSTRLGIKTSTSPTEPTYRNTAKVSPRNMGASSQMFKQPTDQQRGQAITSYLDSELEILDVSRLRWTRDRMALVGRCTNLIRCDMSGIDTTDSAVIALQSCLRLRHLNLSQAKISAQTLANSIPHWRHLQTLQLDSNPQLYDYPNHGSAFLESKWAQYGGVGKRALTNYYTFLHRVRIVSTFDVKTLKKIRRKDNGNGTNRSFEIAVLNAIMNGNVRMVFGQFAVAGDHVVTPAEVRGLGNLMGLAEGIEQDFPMSMDAFALRLVLCLKRSESESVTGVNVWRGECWQDFVRLAWRTVGVERVAGTEPQDKDDASATTPATSTPPPTSPSPTPPPPAPYNVDLVAKQVPDKDWGAVLLRSISMCSSLCSLSVANSEVQDFSFGGFLPPPTMQSHNALHVSKWHEYNYWIRTGRWTSVKLTEKDLQDIAHERGRIKDLEIKIIEFKSRLKAVTEEITSCEKNIAAHGKTKRLGKELEKSEKRFKNIQQRIIEAHATMERLEEEISNMGSIVDG